MASDRLRSIVNYDRQHGTGLTAEKLAEWADAMSEPITTKQAEALIAERNARS